MSQEQIVSKHGFSSSYCAPIVNTKYMEKNYLKRDVIRPDDMPNRKGGEVIDMLHKPMAKFAAQHTHVSTKSSIFQPIKNKIKSRLASAEHSTTALPELLSSPVVRVRNEKNSKTVMEGISVKGIIKTKKSATTKAD